MQAQFKVRVLKSRRVEVINHDTLELQEFSTLSEAMAWIQTNAWK